MQTLALVGDHTPGVLEAGRPSQQRFDGHWQKGCLSQQWRSCWRKVPKALGPGTAPLCRARGAALSETGEQLASGAQSSLAPGASGSAGCSQRLYMRSPSGKGSKLAGPAPAPFCQQPVRSYLALSWPPSPRAGGINFSTFYAKLPPPPTPQAPPHRLRPPQPGARRPFPGGGGQRPQTGVCFLVLFFISPPLGTQRCSLSNGFLGALLWQREHFLLCYASSTVLSKPLPSL